MKRVVLLVVLVFSVLSFTAAEEIELGEFPVGEWMDANYDALWTFSSNNIQLFRTNGTLVYDFKGEVENFELNVTISGLELSYSCKGTARSYKFVKGVSNTDLQLVIDTDSGIHYETDMKFQ
ncbi:MAG: hypothetical protein DRP60_11465 [Spirochaetes bacterium]|nr:MAG: hypothetical protein DRP60_11465 [Spirochaetota bacterium]